MHDAGDTSIVRARLVAMTVFASLLAAGRANAFTAIFLADDDKSTRVTEHRVAIAMLPGETVLWDQVRWSGNPTTLAWVAPVKPGTTSTLTADAWFASLDGSTQTVIFKPPDFGPAAGCAIAGCARDPAFDDGPSKFTVKSSAVAGPTETVTIRGGSPNALQSWLRNNGFTVPEQASASIEAVAREGYDFVVMRLRPDCGAQSTRTFRVVVPGGPSAIPTRMMGIGAGRSVDVTLFTLAPTRQVPVGYGAASINMRDLYWDDDKRTSNYAELRSQALRAASGRAWLTEYADVPDRSMGASAPRQITPSPYEIYPAACGRESPPSGIEVLGADPTKPGPCTSGSRERDAGLEGGAALDASDDESDASDASLDATDASDEDASSDASISDASSEAGDEAGDEADDASATGRDGAAAPTPARDTCASPDDLAIGLRGLDPRDVFVTRMFASISSDTLAGEDLRLVSNASGAVVTNGLQAVAFEDDRHDRPKGSYACESVDRRQRASTLVPLLAAGALVTTLVRRRRR